MKTVFVFDTETTGTDIRTTSVVQLVGVVTTPETTYTVNSTKCRPKHDIAKEASDVHGLYAEDVWLSPYEQVALWQFDLLLRMGYGGPDNVILAGHNIERFDVPLIQELYPQGRFNEYDTLDTYTMAVRLNPHGRQKLGESYEDLTIDRKDDPTVNWLLTHAHDAEADCHMSATLLWHYLGMLNMTPERGVEYCRQPMVWETMPFGKHQGTASSDVPRDYYQWCGRNFTESHKDFMKTIDHYTKKCA